MNCSTILTRCSEISTFVNASLIVVHYYVTNGTLNLSGPGEVRRRGHCESQGSCPPPTITQRLYYILCA